MGIPCPGAVGKCRAWSLAIPFILAEGNETIVFHVAEVETRWITGLDILVAVVLKQKEDYFCVMFEKGLRVPVADPQSTTAPRYTHTFTLSC